MSDGHVNTHVPELNDRLDGQWAVTRSASRPPPSSGDGDCRAETIATILEATFWGLQVILAITEVAAIM